MLLLTAAIKKLRPTAEFSYIDNDYSTIKWDVLDGEAPTQAEINSAIEEIKLERIAEAQMIAEKKAALLEKLGITEDEAKLLLS